MTTRLTVKPEKRGLTIQINKERFALALKTYRLRNGLTQEQLAKKWKMSRWSILRVEKCHEISWEQAYIIYNLLMDELQKESGKYISD